MHDMFFRFPSCNSIHSTRLKLSNCFHPIVLSVHTVVLSWSRPTSPNAESWSSILDSRILVDVHEHWSVVKSLTSTSIFPWPTWAFSAITLAPAGVVAEVDWKLVVDAVVDGIAEPSPGVPKPSWQYAILPIRILSTVFQNYWLLANELNIPALRFFHLRVSISMRRNVTTFQHCFTPSFCTRTFPARKP